jgi:RimJ/RimL family protein N-acetyltransferase
LVLQTTAGQASWAGREFSLKTIHAFVAKENEASRRVLLRAGFNLAGEETMPFQGSVQPVGIFEELNPGA